MKTVFNTLSNRNVIVTLTLIAVLSIILTSCGSTRNVGNGYQKHLSHKHKGSHYLNTNNKGCNWANN
jgi:hypothetical protein